MGWLLIIEPLNHWNFEPMKRIGVDDDVEWLQTRRIFGTMIWTSRVIGLIWCEWNLKFETYTVIADDDVDVLLFCFAVWWWWQKNKWNNKSGGCPPYQFMDYNVDDENNNLTTFYNKFRSEELTSWPCYLNILFKKKWGFYLQLWRSFKNLPYVI